MNTLADENPRSLKNSNKNVEMNTAKADNTPSTGTKQKQLNIENTQHKNSQKKSIDSKTISYLSAFDRKNPLYTEDSKRLDFMFRRNYYRKAKNQNINKD